MTDKQTNDLLAYMAELRQAGNQEAAEALRELLPSQMSLRDPAGARCAQSETSLRSIATTGFLMDY